jgi:ABC-type transport system involved in multi-copper enzyme maturation permease subunit
VEKSARAKIETLRVLGILSACAAAILASIAAPAMAIAAERGTVGPNAPAYIYAVCLWFAVAGVGLALVRRWAAVAFAVPIVAFIAFYLITAAKETTPAVFAANAAMSPGFVLPVVANWWARSVLRKP